MREKDISLACCDVFKIVNEMTTGSHTRYIQVRHQFFKKIQAQEFIQFISINFKLTEHLISSTTCIWENYSYSAKNDEFANSVNQDEVVHHGSGLYGSTLS